jgi:hypothetical protein
VSLHDQRRIPVGDIALIDRVSGASGLPETETREARSADHLLLLKGGSSAKGRLLQIVGGEGSGVAGARAYVFRTTDGREQSFPPEQVGRIYLGSYPFAAAVTGATTVDASIPRGGIQVPARSSWVSTGIIVRKGEWLGFNTTGEVRLSDNESDRAQAPGGTRRANFAPLPAVNAGALIGRIGPTGNAFGIGDQTRVPMPAAGELFLAVNDDERADNSGQFIVAVTRNPS